MTLERFGRVYTYSHLTHYSHLGQDDARLWDQYISNNPDRFTEIIYDLRLGNGQMPDTDVTDRWGQGYKQLTQKRADILATDGKNLFLIELKPRASVIALGQIVAYKTLFATTYPSAPTPSALIITDIADTDIFAAAATLHVTIESAYTVRSRKQ